MLCALCLAVAGCQTGPGLTDPCDVLVRMEPRPATNSLIVARDRPFAMAVAQHRGRYQRYRCAQG